MEDKLAGAGYSVAMIAWAEGWIRKTRTRIRLREPEKMTIVTGCARESIDATFDEGQRLIHLIVHTRHGSLSRRLMRRG